MTTPDPLADWWAYEVVLERYLGSGAYGDVYDEPASCLAMIDGGTRLVVGADGKQAVSSSTVYAPMSVADVPVGSRVTLPSDFGGRTATVVMFARHQSTQDTPNHIEMALS